MHTFVVRLLLAAQDPYMALANVAERVILCVLMVCVGV
jgi:hypothetical protein